MPSVIDATVAACWAFDDENHPSAALALDHLVTDGIPPFDLAAPMRRPKQTVKHRER